MMGQKGFEPKIFYGLSLEEMVPEDHLVRILSKVLDLGFVRDLCKDYYSQTGQPSVDPVVLFKMMLLGYFSGITSERKLAENCSLNLAFRWYLGYDFDEATPDHSVISKARVRFGKEVFEEFFQRILEICIEKGLVCGEKIFVDATLVDANASLKSLVSRDNIIKLEDRPAEFVKKFFEENAEEESNTDGEDKGGKGQGYGKTSKESSMEKGKGKNKTPSRDSMKWGPQNRGMHRSNKDCKSSTDPDASYIGRGNRGASFSYKCSYAVNGYRRVITAVVTTPGAVADEYMLEELLDKQPLWVGEVGADSIYGTIANYKLCAERGIRPSISPRYSKRRTGRIPKKEYKYSAIKDAYICPQGKEVKKSYYDKKRDRWHYSTRAKDCRGCPLKSRCCPNTATLRLVRRVGQEYTDWASLWLKTGRAKRTIKERGRFSECAFAEAKTLHGLGRAKCRGLEKVAIQGLMTASVQNIKRIINTQRGKDRKVVASSFCKYSKNLPQLLKHRFPTPQFSYSM